MQQIQQMQTSIMDVRRPFYVNLGTAVVNVVVPLVVGIIQVLVITVDLLESLWFIIFGRRLKLETSLPNIAETPERNEQEPIINVPFEHGNFDIRRRQQLEQPANQSELQHTENDTAIQILRLLEDGVVDTVQQAKIALHLICLQLSTEDAADAARHTSSVDSALAYLNQHCEACNNSYPMSQMVHMLNCTHSCCRTCAKNFFSMQIRHHNVTDCVCPYCRLPHLNNQGTSTCDIKDYFDNLYVLFKNLLTADVFSIFLHKLNIFLNERANTDNVQSALRNVKEVRQQLQNMPKERIVITTERLQQSTHAPSRTQQKELNFQEINEHRALTIFQDDKVDNYDQAKLAATLMSMQFNEIDSIDAAKSCCSMDTAISYLSQECRTCRKTFSMKKIFSMLNCEHRFCRTCASEHFTDRINNHEVTDCVCPTCESPDLEGDEMSEDDVGIYYSNLDIILKDLLDGDVHERFLQMLRESALKNDPTYDNEPTSLSESLQRQARQFVEQHRVRNYMQSELAIRLIQEDYSEEDALEAVKHCSTLNGAISFLEQECQLCADTFRMNQMVSMLSCEHRCCTDCAKSYFTERISERTILDCNCPFCSIPDLNNDAMTEAELNNYFSNLDIMLRNILDPAVHEVFQKKLRDWSLTKNENFKWCPLCSSGYIADDVRGAVTCPDCRGITCVSCRRPWEDQHAGISCERFTEWKELNDPQQQEAGLESHLAINGINCPKCKHRFSLARGGCMHFTCSQCKHEFCQGCAKPFSRNCSICRSSGLHAHHPRNCLYYLRDHDPSVLQALLRKYKVPFDTARPADSPNSDTCLVNSDCSGRPQEGYAGLCRLHYVEYLAGLINKNRLDPADVLDVTSITREMTRRGIAIPKHDAATTTPEAYKDSCVKIVKDKIPLDG